MSLVSHVVLVALLSWHCARERRLGRPAAAVGVPGDASAGRSPTAPGYGVDSPAPAFLWLKTAGTG
ncbi:hypothetical protein ASG23_14580 [Cellulomonas sp. Leaf395]|nr:hypothetical protein ASG23_14580 [Cellulomonas sp. Leaf395]